MVGWPSGPRRQFKALVSLEAWVRIPLQRHPGILKQCFKQVNPTPPVCVVKKCKVKVLPGLEPGSQDSES